VLIDHVLLATRDIDAAARRLLDRYGLASVRGGEHPQWGTGNRIVPVGDAYIEIIGITDAEVAATAPLGRWITSHTTDGDVLAGVMIEPTDFDGVCTRLGLTPIPGMRDLADGTSVSWRLAGLAEAMAQTIPCFISWDSRKGRLGSEAPQGGVSATGIAWLELGGDAQAVTAWLGDEVVPGLRLVGGPPGIRALAISTPDGPVVLPERP